MKIANFDVLNMKITTKSIISSSSGETKYVAYASIHLPVLYMSTELPIVDLSETTASFAFSLSYLCSAHQNL